MSHLLGVRPYRKRHYRTLSLLCDDEPLSDAQLKAYQTRLQEYQTFLGSVVRLALCGNVCVTEEAVTIGEHGLLTGESLNALQHAGAISVYNTLQQNNWEFPVPEDCEVAVVKSHNPIPDEFLDSEKPIRSDWPAVHISECFIEGEKAKLHGSVRPLRTFLPPTVIFRNAADVDEDVVEAEMSVPSHVETDTSIELIESDKGIAVKRIKKDGHGVDYVPLEEYYFGREDGTQDYCEEKGDFRFKCAVCQSIFYSNITLMTHILGHVDETSRGALNEIDTTQCHLCNWVFPSNLELRNHMDQAHNTSLTEPLTSLATDGPLVAQTASQLLMQHRLDGTFTSQPPNSALTNTLASVWNCRICGKEAASQLALAHHLQSMHRQQEMPYVCRLCLFRSSVLEDILEHFKKVHDNSNHLLCTYCLRIFTPPDARATPHTASHVPSSVGQTQVYLQHLRMHQIRQQVRRCPSCKLTFTNKSDYQVHRRLDHKGVRSDSTTKLDELPPDILESDQVQVTNEDALTENTSYLKDTQPHVTLMNAPEASRIISLASIRLPENTDQMNCLECDQSLSSAEHKKYMSCTLCRFGTCCAMGYNRHMSCVHVYISGTHPTEPDCSMPLVRPVYFDWIADEIRAFNLSQETETNVTTPLESVTEQTKTTDLDDQDSAPIDNSTKDTHKVSEAENACATSDTPMLSQDIMQSDGAHMVSQINVQKTNEEPDVSDLLASENDIPLDKHVESVTSEHNQEVSTQNTVCTSTASDLAVIPVSSDHDQWAMVRTYMSLQLDARHLACIHCAITHLNGNTLARHLVEECGTNTATINPNPALVKARLELEEQQRLQREQQMTEQAEADILFESTEVNTPGPVHMNVNVCGQSAVAANDDVIMVSVAPEQLSSYGLVQPTDTSHHSMVDNQPVDSAGTTIDVTDANGTVVQQFLIPDDLQLEEGQTLVVIHDENGQPQLAIVNQADLVDPNNPHMLLQTDEDETNSMLLYSNAVDQQMQVMDGVMVAGSEDEKENHQFSL